MAQAENCERTELHMHQLVEVTNLISQTEKRLRPWMGRTLAINFSRFLHPIATYRFSLLYGGLGCSSRHILMPWINFILLFLCQWWMIYLYDFKTFLMLVVKVGQVNFITWLLCAASVTILYVLLLSIFVNLITGTGILLGTILRGMNREHIKGMVNLDGTGKTNFILRKMGYQEH
jgi:hypothetical protein